MPVVDAVNKAQQTPLHLACRHNAAAAVSLLLSAHAYINAPDADGLHPLHYACKHGHAQLIAPLLAAGADIEAPATDLWRPLHYAAASGRAATLSALLSAAANTTATTTRLEQPLHLAIAAECPAAVEALLATPTAASAINAATASGQRPLDVALQQYAACAPSPSASTPRSAAAALRVIRLLLARGALATAPPLVLACSLPGPATLVLPLVETLVAAAGAVVDARALAAACVRPNCALDVVRMLVASGARPRHEHFRALWRNARLELWEKRAVHAVLNEVAEPALRKDEAEWAIVAM
ncbi:hypothetical protein SLS56_000958 [Neofusicoccum ribis]|uniref:Ankyrin repeat protein n=1 Tax=Neofusicoccum ribis TaxID=45134 RepID=A0ABR3TBQ1_9PEZI